MGGTVWYAWRCAKENVFVPLDAKCHSSVLAFRCLNLFPLQLRRETFCSPATELLPRSYTLPVRADVIFLFTNLLLTVKYLQLGRKFGCTSRRMLCLGMGVGDGLCRGKLPQE